MKKTTALTADIIGFPEDNEIEPRWRPYYQRLLQMRNELVRVTSDLKDSAHPEKQEFSSGADGGRDLYDQSFTLGVISSEQMALYEIDQALQRIRNGKYGVCEITGKPIEEERLNAIPWTRFSLEAQNELEAKGQSQQTAASSKGNDHS